MSTFPKSAQAMPSRCRAVLCDREGLECGFVGFLTVTFDTDWVTTSWGDAPIAAALRLPKQPSLEASTVRFDDKTTTHTQMSVHAVATALDGGAWE